MPSASEIEQALERLLTSPDGSAGEIEIREDGTFQAELIPP
jgi:hypothetical protein